jgi:phosphohistidine phosphatase
MKLYIARHAKSSWEDFTLSDHERPILDKGKKKTIVVANELKRRGEIPEIIMSSTAVRASQTAEIFAEIMGYPKDKIIYNKNLYHANDDQILEELYGLDNNIKSIMIVAHNPGLTDLVNIFTKDFIYNLPTSGVACVKFKSDKWENIDTCKHKVEFILTPRMLSE